MIKKLLELDQINQFIKMLEKNRTDSHKKCFPKICRNCNKNYKCYNEFVSDTSSTKDPVVIDKTMGIYEYRNCLCGSTLAVAFKIDKRDGSSFGEKRRIIFEACVQNIIDHSSMPENEAKEFVRKIIRRMDKKCFVIPKK